MKRMMATERFGELVIRHSKPSAETFSPSDSGGETAEPRARQPHYPSNPCLSSNHERKARSLWTWRAAPLPHPAKRLVAIPRGSNLRSGHGTGRKRSKALQDCAGGITHKFLILKQSGEHNLHDGVLCQLVMALIPRPSQVPPPWNPKKSLP